MRRISLDTETVQVLVDHAQRFEDQAATLGVGPAPDAFVFSYQPLHDAPADPSAVTHRYGRMCSALGIDSHLHALRHYSATELLTAGVDLRTVAGRLGHGGGNGVIAHRAILARPDGTYIDVMTSNEDARTGGRTRPTPPLDAETVLDKTTDLRP